MDIDRQDSTAGLTGSTELTTSETLSTKFDFTPYVSEMFSFLRSFGKASWLLYSTSLSGPCFHLVRF